MRFIILASRVSIFRYNRLGVRYNIYDNRCPGRGDHPYFHRQVSLFTFRSAKADQSKFRNFALTPLACADVKRTSLNLLSLKVRLTNNLRRKEQQILIL